MIRWKFIFRLWVIFITSVIFTDAQAGNRAGSFSFSLAEGYYYFAAKRHIDDTNITNFSLAYYFTKNWGMEGLVGFLNTNSHHPDDNGNQVKGNVYVMDVVYHFSPYKTVLEPYLLIGVGILGLNPNGSSAHNLGNINAGIGAQIFFHPSMAFRLEARDFYTMVGGYNDVLLNGGMSFLFL